MARRAGGSVKVLVQLANDSLDAIAVEAFSSRSVRTWNSGSAPWRYSPGVWPATLSGLGGRAGHDGGGHAAGYRLSRRTEPPEPGAERFRLERRLSEWP